MDAGICVRLSARTCGWESEVWRICTVRDAAVHCD